MWTQSRQCHCWELKTTTDSSGFQTPQIRLLLPIQPVQKEVGDRIQEMLPFARRRPPQVHSILNRTLFTKACKPVTLRDVSRLIDVRLTAETRATLNPSHFLLYPSILTPREQSLLLKHALIKLDNTLGVPRKLKQRRKHLDAQPLCLEGDPTTHFWPEDCYEFEEVCIFTYLEFMSRNLSRFYRVISTMWFAVIGSAMYPTGWKSPQPSSTISTH
jgi:hypothetical protein